MKKIIMSQVALMLLAVNMAQAKLVDCGAFIWVDAKGNIETQGLDTKYYKYTIEMLADILIEPEHMNAGIPYYNYIIMKEKKDFHRNVLARKYEITGMNRKPGENMFLVNHKDVHGFSIEKDSPYMVITCEPRNVVDVH